MQRSSEGRMIRANHIRLGNINHIPHSAFNAFRFCPERYVNGTFLPTLTASELAKRGFMAAASARVDRDK